MPREFTLGHYALWVGLQPTIYCCFSENDKSADIIKRRLLNVVCDSQKLRNFLYQVLAIDNECPRGMYLSPLLLYGCPYGAFAFEMVLPLIE